MIESKVTALELKTGALAVDLGSGLYGFFDNDKKAFALSIDVFLNKNEMLFLNRYDAVRMRKALDDMVEVLGWKL